MEIYCFTSHRSFVRLICCFVFVHSRGRWSILQAVKHETVLCLCVLSVYHAGGQTRDVDPMSGYCWRRSAIISQVLGYLVVFNATPNVGQRHRRRANINPALVQSIVTVPPTCRYLLYVCGLWSSQQARSLRPVLVQCWPTVCDAGSALNRRWVEYILFCCDDDGGYCSVDSTHWPSVDLVPALNWHLACLSILLGDQMTKKYRFWTFILSWI